MWSLPALNPPIRKVWLEDGEGGFSGGGATFVQFFRQGQAGGIIVTIEVGRVSPTLMSSLSAIRALNFHAANAQVGMT